MKIMKIQYFQLFVFVMLLVFTINKCQENGSKTIMVPDHDDEDDTPKKSLTGELTN